MMKKEIRLCDIAGYATERTVWRMILSLSRCLDSARLGSVTPQTITIADEDFLLKETKISNESNSRAFSAPETFSTSAKGRLEESCIWTIGALAFNAITGTDVFEGKGGESQTIQTEIPRLSSTHASQELSMLIRQCLCYTPQNRPTKDELVRQAQSALAQPIVPRKKLTNQAGKSYKSSLIKFWPEGMIPLILMCLLMLCPMAISSQPQQKFDKSVIPNEMATLVLRCIDLRSPQNVDKVGKAMDRDLNWTMMDELPLDKNGECTTKDKVEVFGLNDIGFRILKRHGGVTNSGGRFRDGRDPRYKYSFIEITVKKGATVTYPITGREGEQIFAVVPFEKDAQFVASIPDAKTFTDNGVCYIQLKRGMKKTDIFYLTVMNKSGKNMAFALINYNSRNHE